MAINYPQRYDDDFINTFKKVIDVINTKGESLLDDEFFAEWINKHYKPIFTGEWDNTKEYDGLSIVTYQGASYTSKKEVPVGVDISNEEYWALTGNYDAQVENYRQDVQQMSGDLAGKVNKKDLFISVNDLIDNETGSLSDILNTKMVSGMCYYFPDGVYTFDTSVVLPENTDVIANKAVIKGVGFRVTGDDNQISGFTFDGTDKDPTVSDAMMGVQVSYSRNTMIENNKFIESMIYAGTSGDNPDTMNEEDLKILNNSFLGDYDKYNIDKTVSRPLRIGGVNSFTFKGNTFDCKTTTSVIKMQGGRIEQGVDYNYIGDDYTNKVILSDNIFKGECKEVISLYSGAGDVLITNNIFEVGTPGNPANMIINGKTYGADSGGVYTNKIRNIVISNNVFKCHLTGRLVRVHGGYGLQWEGDEQAFTFNGNIIEGSSGADNRSLIQAYALHSFVASNNNINFKNSAFSNYFNVFDSRGVKNTLISSNYMSEGSILISNIEVYSEFDIVTGIKNSNIERVSVIGNVFEKWMSSAAVSLQEISNGESDIIISNNNMKTDRWGSPYSYPVIMEDLQARTLLMNGNIAINTSKRITGETPVLTGSTFEKKVDANNSWN